jgi:hypothetical protein
VIDFNDRSEAEAANYRLPFARVSERVMPERMQNKRKPRRDYWWLFAERATGMRKAIADLSEVLVIALVSKTVMPLRVSAGQVFSHALGVFATDSYGDQAVLSSSLHQLWAITYGSTLETRVRYTPSDVFETFPRPLATSRLDAAGRALDVERRTIMRQRDIGLTKLYNLVNDGAVQGDKDVNLLRQIHVEVDAAAMAAYGWDDVELDHGFHEFRQMVRWSPSPLARVEALDRLLLENHRRAGSQAADHGQQSSSKPRPLEPDTLFG